MRVISRARASPLVTAHSLFPRLAPRSRHRSRHRSPRRPPLPSPPRSARTRALEMLERLLMRSDHRSATSSSEPTVVRTRVWLVQWYSLVSGAATKRGIVSYDRYRSDRRHVWHSRTCSADQTSELRSGPTLTPPHRNLQIAVAVYVYASNPAFQTWRKVRSESARVVSSLDRHTGTVVAPPRRARR